MHIVLVATENDALPGGKVGGLGDVIRDLPVALSQVGHKVTVITPGYGIFACGGNSSQQGRVEIDFCGTRESVSVFTVEPEVSHPQVCYWILEHWLFSAAGAGKIYVNDDAGPFATDAHRFALFNTAVCELLTQNILGPVDVLHCHDWHTGPLLILRRFAARYQSLQKIGTVFSIHNLSLQGVRPFRGVESSLESWYQGMHYASELIADPHHPDCVNLMRSGITLADRVHTVSPTYAREIVRPSNWEQGVVGGEGLEGDLQCASEDGRLFGILNGCDYERKVAPRLAQGEVWNMIANNLDLWAARLDTETASYYFALRQLSAWKRRRRTSAPVLVSIGRLTAQKLYLPVQELGDDSVMDALLHRLDPGIFIMMGTGDADYDQFFTRIMDRHANFLYLCGYSDALADTLYSFADLFVMPSVYEPCGVSQMLAMRAGVPCLVHQVGGLNDTVIDGDNGFSFGGDTLQEKLQALVATLDTALDLYRNEPAVWNEMREAARASRFSWDESVKRYCDQLYFPLAGHVRI